MQACTRDEMYLGKVPGSSGEPVASPQGSAVHDTGMANWPLSRTLSLLGVAILVHLIVMTSLAERGTENMVMTGSGKSKRSVDVKRHRNSENTVVSGQTDGRGALFATDNSTVVTAQTGSTATLPCVVRKFGTGVVSWIRKKDYHLLTVGVATYSSDDRFIVEHARHLQNWGLQIKFIQPRDAGMYECQVSTHPPSSIFVELRVTEAAAEIQGAPDLHIKSGSKLRLVCTLRQSTETPVYVFWYHGQRMINYDKERGVSVKSDRKSSVLTIDSADKGDTGNYTCVPSNAKPASINVHVLNGEKPAAMQHGVRSNASNLVSTTRPQICLAVALFASCLIRLWPSHYLLVSR